MSGPKHVSFYLIKYIDRMHRQLDRKEHVECSRVQSDFDKTPEEHRADLLARFGIKR